MEKDLQRLEEAVIGLVSNLRKGKSAGECLAEWDRARGNAWFYDESPQHMRVAHSRYMHRGPTFKVDIYVQSLPFLPGQKGLHVTTMMLEPHEFWDVMREHDVKVIRGEYPPQEHSDAA